MLRLSSLDSDGIWLQYNDKPKRLPSEPRSLQTHARYFLYERVPTSAACLSIPSTLPASALPSPALVDVAMENANEVRAKDLPAAALPSAALVDAAMDNANEVRAKDFSLSFLSILDSRTLCRLSVLEK